MLKRKGDMLASQGSAVSVSKGHLSAERIRVLASEVQQEDQSLKTAIIAVFIILLGIGVAYFLSEQFFEISPPPKPLGVSQPL
jgi:hypothetical protein